MANRIEKFFENQFLRPLRKVNTETGKKLKSRKRGKEQYDRTIRQNNTSGEDGKNLKSEMFRKKKLKKLV